MTSLQTAATSYNRALLNFFPYSFITAIKNVSLKHKSMHSIEVMPHQGSSNKAAKAFQGWQQQKTRNISIATFSLQQSQAAIHSRFRIVHRMENTQLSRWSFEDVWDSPREDTRTVKHRLKYSKCRMRASSATVYTKKLWTQTVSSPTCIHCVWTNCERESKPSQGIDLAGKQPWEMGAWLQQILLKAMLY